MGVVALVTWHGAGHWRCEARATHVTVGVGGAPGSGQQRARGERWPRSSRWAGCPDVGSAASGVRWN